MLAKNQSDFMSKMRKEISDISSVAGDSKARVNILDKKLSGFESESRHMHDEKKDAIQEINNAFEELKTKVEGSYMERDVEIDLRLKTEDFK